MKKIPSRVLYLSQCFGSGSGSGRIRIIGQDPDPDPDPDPYQDTLIWIRVPKKNRDKLAYKSTKIIKILFFFKRNHLFCLIFVNNKLKITKKKHRYEF